MKSLKTVFMGSPQFAVQSLDLLHQSPHEITAVVSNPDKRRGRRGTPIPTDVKKRALELGLSTIDADDLNSPHFHEQLSELKPDLIVIVAFRILPEQVLRIPAIGSINLHASLLPKYRGAAPIHWAVINGEKETGCTIFYLDEKVDTGKIISQKKTGIDPMETTGDLYNRLKNMGAELLLKSINQIADGKETAIPQDHSLATPAPKFFRENTRIDFNRSAIEVHNFVRGLNPFPVAWCKYGGEKLNIYSTTPTDLKDLEPGELLFKSGQLLAGCYGGAVQISELQLPGKKIMSGTDFANGYSLNVKLK